MIDPSEKYWGVKTWIEAVKRWDRGEVVWSVSMGGLGPGYEQCIQILVFEILAHWPVSKAGRRPDEEEWKTHCREVAAPLKELGLSWLQVKAASDLAFRFVTDGYVQAMEDTVRERRIQVTREFPELQYRRERKPHEATKH